MSTQLSQLSEILERRAQQGKSSLGRRQLSKKRGKPKSKGDTAKVLKDPIPASARQEQSVPSEPVQPTQQRDWTVPANKGLMTRKGHELVELFAEARKLRVWIEPKTFNQLRFIEQRIKQGDQAFPALNDYSYNKLLSLIDMIKERIKQKKQEAVEATRKKMDIAIEQLETLRQEIIEEFGEEQITSCGLEELLLQPVQTGHNRSLKQHFGYCRRVLSGELKPLIDEKLAFEQLKLRAEQAEAKREEMMYNRYYRDIVDGLGDERRRTQYLMHTPMDIVCPDANRVRELEEAIQTVLREEERLEHPESQRHPHANRTGAWRTRKESVSTAGPAKGSGTGSGDGGKKGLAGGDTRNAKKRRRRHGITA